MNEDDSAAAMILQQSATFERKSDGAIAIQCSVCFFSGFSTCHCNNSSSSSSSNSNSNSNSSSTNSCSNMTTPPPPPGSGSGSGGGKLNSSKGPASNNNKSTIQTSVSGSAKASKSGRTSDRTGGATTMSSSSPEKQNDLIQFDGNSSKNHQRDTIIANANVIATDLPPLRSGKIFDLRGAKMCQAQDQSPKSLSCIFAYFFLKFDR